MTLAVLRGAHAELLLEGVGEVGQALESAFVGDDIQRQVFSVVDDDAAGVVQAQMERIGHRGHACDGSDARTQLVAADSHGCRYMVHIDVLIGHLGIDDVNKLAHELLVFFIHGRTEFVGNRIAAPGKSLLEEGLAFYNALGYQFQLAGIERLDEDGVGTGFKT